MRRRPAVPFFAVALSILACRQGLAMQDAPTQAPTLPATATSSITQPAGEESLLPSTVTLSGAQGLELQGTHMPAANAEAPAVLLLHMYGSDRRSWQSYAEDLAAAGIASLAIDLRGHGDTGGEEDWELAQQDVAAAFDWLQANPGVDPSRVGILGASIGANLALVQASSYPVNVAAAALLSPGLDYFRVEIEGLAKEAQGVPLFLAASENDGYSAETVRILAEEAPGNNTLSVFDGASHGTDMFASHPELADTLTQFLLEAFGH